MSVDRWTSPAHDADRDFMAEALALAAGVPARTWPNPPVGAVVVRDGRVVGRGAHAGPGQAHAEIVALAEAGEAARGATLYVTLEPCNHTGRTGPCAPTVAESGLRRVVVAMRDPNPGVLGGGCRHLRDRGLAVAVGCLAAEALELAWPFAVTEGFRRPYVELKTAVSLDGRFAPDPAGRSAGTPAYLTGEEARRDVHRRRRRVDLVLVGEGTVRADRPRLDGRLVAGEAGVPAADPLPGYVDTDLSWTGGLPAARYLVFAGRGAREAAGRRAVEAGGGEIVFCRERDGRVDPADLLQQMAARGLMTVMVEGGPRLASSFLAAGLVDRWLRYEALRVLGSGVAWPPFPGPGRGDAGGFSLTGLRPLGPDLLAILDRSPFAAALGRVTL
jgi:diaminohydroxyphosphoribosylaminopyrimidine deaminase/5-amino-6-(5-phosphoribosylamino)uracil reductase